MKSRLVAALAVSALVLTGATGCTFITPQSTKLTYSGSDGVNLGDTGPVEVRNAMIIANDEGTAGNLVAGFVNTSDERQTIVVEVKGADPIKVSVPAGELMSLGANADPIAIEGFRGMPGSTIEVFFQSGDATGEATQVPVLDATQPYYADLAPRD